MKGPDPSDRLGFPTGATDGDLGEAFFELFGRIVVLAAANERLVELLGAEIEGVSINTLVGRAALPTRLAVARAIDRLRAIETEIAAEPYFRAAIEMARSFLERVEEVSEIRNGYIHSAWLVDDRRRIADNFERRPEFLGLRLSARNASPGMIQHHPRNLDELRADLIRFAEVNQLGRAALDGWRERRAAGPGSGQ